MSTIISKKTQESLKHKDRMVKKICKIHTLFLACIFIVALVCSFVIVKTCFDLTNDNMYHYHNEHYTY